MWDFVVRYWMEAAFAAILGLLGILWKRFQREKKANAALRDGMKALLRDRIIQMYGICKSKGFCSLPEREALVSLYTAYHDGLGGNGTVSDVYNAMRAMPTEKERKENQ